MLKKVVSINTVMEELINYYTTPLILKKNAMVTNKNLAFNLNVFELKSITFLKITVLIFL